MIKKLKQRRKLILGFMVCCLLSSLMAVTCFATDGTAPSSTQIMNDLGTTVTGILAQGEAVFGFLTSSAVLPWILIGVAVSLVGTGIFWARWIMWGR